MLTLKSIRQAPAGFSYSFKTLNVDPSGQVSFFVSTIVVGQIVEDFPCATTLAGKQSVNSWNPSKVNTYQTMLSCVETSKALNNDK